MRYNALILNGSPGRDRTSDQPVNSEAGDGYTATHSKHFLAISRKALKIAHIGRTIGNTATTWLDGRFCCPHVAPGIWPGGRPPCPTARVLTDKFIKGRRERPRPPKGCPPGLLGCRSVPAMHLRITDTGAASFSLDGAVPPEPQTSHPALPGNCWPASVSDKPAPRPGNGWASSNSGSTRLMTRKRERARPRQTRRQAKPPAGR